MIKKKNLVLIIIATFVFTALLSCGIFAVVTKSVSFNLALKVEPKVFFSMTLQVSNDDGGTWSTEKEIFNNQTGANVVNWATVNQNTIVLNQVLAGESLPEIRTDSKLKLTVTNLTEKSAQNAEEYLHLTLNYHSEDVKTFTMDNGYGIVNMEYGEETATQSMIITASSILADTYILIPFLAEIDALRYTATITTENCEVVSAPRTFVKNSLYKATFGAQDLYHPMYECTVTVGESAFNIDVIDGFLEIPASKVSGNIIIEISAWGVWDGTFPPVNASSIFGGGNGTEANPYLITIPEHLAQLSVNVNDGTTYEGQYFEMTRDIYLNYGDVIDCNGSLIQRREFNQWQAIGTSDPNSTFGDDPLNPFYGFFNGNGKVVGGIYINKPSTNAQGLFGYSLGSIVNLGVENGLICGKRGVGGVVGCGTGQIISCYNEITVCGREFVGGLVGGFKSAPGENTGFVLENCYNSGRIKCFDNQSNSGKDGECGGLIGSIYVNADSAITNCYSVGEIETFEANIPVGVLVGEVNSSAGCTGITTMSYCYGESTNIITKLGGNCHATYFQTVESSIQTRDNLKDKRYSNTNWDFENVWDINPSINDGYPFLRVFHPELYA